MTAHRVTDLKDVLELLLHKPAPYPETPHLATVGVVRIWIGETLEAGAADECVVMDRAAAVGEDEIDQEVARYSMQMVFDSVLDSLLDAYGVERGVEVVSQLTAAKAAAKMNGTTTKHSEEVVQVQKPKP